MLLQGASGTRSGSRQDVLEAATDYSLAGSNPPYELKDTNDKNDIDKTNNIMDHNDDIQHAAKAGGGAKCYAELIKVFMDWKFQNTD